MSYKSALRAKQPSDQTDGKYRSQAQTLQELFPAWSNDDLQSLLAEVAGDVELAATRISDGRAEQWGSVTRKKDKKAPIPSHTSKDSSSGRGDSRGGRGGRSGRGGPGRGGAALRSRGGTPRGGAFPSTNGHPVRDTANPLASPTTPITPWGDGGVPAANATTDKAPGDTPNSSPEGAGWPNDQQDGVTPSTSSWVDSSSSQLETPPTTTSQSTPPSAWGGTSTSTWGGDTDINGSASSLNVSMNVAPGKVSKTPATSKLSWAQIARPQEKLTPLPLAPGPIAAPPPASAPPSFEPTLAPEPEPEPQHQGWEEPTTVQPPTWDDELPVKLSTSAADVWSSTQTEEPKTEQQEEEQQEELPNAPAAPEPVLEPTPAPREAEPEPAVVTATASPPKPIAPRPVTGAHRSSARYKTIDQPVVMPSSFGSGVEKIGMQFGSLSLGGESLFDSNPPEPEATSTRTQEPSAPEAQSPPTPQAQLHHEPPQASASATSGSLSSGLFQQQGIPQPSQQQSPPQQSVSQHSLGTSISQPTIQAQPQAPSHAAAAASPIQQFAQHQQSVSQQQSLSSSHQQQQQQQQPQQPHQQPHQIPQQTQSHSHHQYAQHGLPTHIDPSQQSQAQHSPVPQVPQQPPSAGHASYIRQSEAAPYFHTPTPPAGQAQETPYGSFGQLGGQAQHQQGSHLGGFAAAEYGYGDGQRGFYESYVQQSGFGNRNVLGHDDVKGLPGAQQPPTSAGLPPANPQTSQQHPPASQGATQPQPAAGQPPQQGYPAPVPYYYNPYPQNQYYGSPYNSAYGVPQPFVKYPTMFQPGPPGPGSAPSPATKQPGANVGVGVGVQPQSNPYGQGLYAQHQQASYDDYQHHTQHQHQQHQHQQHQHHTQHQQHQHALGLGQGGVGTSGEYGKQLYAGAGQGMQGFMGLGGQSNAPSGGGPRATGGASPETPYKPYAPKDVGGVGVGGVGVGTGRGAAVQQQQQQQGPQGQGPPGQGQVQGQPQQGGQGGFYGGNRFGSAGGVGGGGVAAGVGAGAGGVGGGPQGGVGQSGHHQQQGGPQGHLGYPQGGSDGSFYSYQPRQQQGYWQ